MFRGRQNVANGFHVSHLWILRITRDKFDDYSRISPFCDAIVNRVDPIYTS